MLPLEYHEGLVGTAPSQSREDQGYDADLEDSDGAHMTSFRPPNAQHAIASTARRRSSGPIIEISVPVDYVAIDDDDDDAEEPALLDDEDCVLLDILPDTSETGAAAQASVNHHSTKTLTSWLIDGNECKGVVTKGVCVELANGEFLIIDQILQDLTTEIHLTGTRLVRALKLDSFLSNKLNEVVMMRDYLEQRSGIRQPKGPHVVNLASVLHVRDLVRTNAVFPKFSYRSHHSPEVLARQKHRWHEHYSQLTCRWEFSSVWKPKKHRPSEFTIKVLDQRDCGEEYFIPPAELRYDWRGDTIPGGSSLEIDDRPWQTPKTSASHGKLPGARRSSTIQQAAERIQLAERSSPRSSISGSSHTAAPSPQLSIRRMPPHTLPPSRGLPTIEQQRVYEDLNTRGRDLFLSSAGSSSRCPSGAPPVLRGDAATIEVSPHLPSPVAAKTANQRYTFGDGFCGAGGVSRGAKAAGVRLSWAFDKDERASGAYAINFPESWTYFEDVHSFLHIQDNKKVDIMHLSPPCQTFSPAHTIAGKDDDANEAALFSVEDLIKAARPRLFSLEQTFGITWESNKKFFNNLIRQLLDQGYSTRWGLVQCLDYGGPKRTRLIIFAAW